MTSTAALASCLDYYAANRLALFPIPHGQKSPVGIVESFARDWSQDRAQWETWHAVHNCNFGIVAGPSRLIILDIDAKDDRDAAWAAWCDLCAEWNISPATPQIQSARGGWHVYFAVPEDVDASALRQPDAIRGKINIRAGNGFTVTAGSYFEGAPYILMSAAPPYPAPAALIAHCTRAAPDAATTRTAPPPGSRDMGDVAALLTWLNERGAFNSYEEWFQCGMALKIEYGDAGRDLWALIHDETVTADVEQTKWQSFATDVTSQSVTLNTFLQRAHSLGWRGSVRKSASAMFDGVAALAAATGATLASQSPGTPMANGTDALFAGQAELARVGTPILQDFLNATADAPNFPLADDFPMLPESLSGHGLYVLMNTALNRIAAMIEPPQKFKSTRVVEPLGVLGAMNLPELSAAVHRRISMLGHALPDRQIRLAKERISEVVERVTVTLDKWEYDPRTGQIESDNSDNVQVLLGVLGLSLRWNAWFEKMEIRGGADNLYWSDWTYVDDAIIARIRTRANRTKTRFRPGKDFLWESLLTIAHENAVDPVLDLFTELQAAWDGTPRLTTWLARYCGTPCDAYHQAVGRNIIGGMVVRAREPGIKFDTMAVFYGQQGTGKSSLAEILSLDSKWFIDSVMLGDASKELILSLAGKLIAEIGEMGMRSGTDANHVKAMISRQVDEGRTAYARAVTRRERRNIFIGTTNEDTPLQDPTGNRRFLPVRIASEIDLAGLRADVRQLVGEACAQHAAGRSFELPRDVWESAAAYQDAAREISQVEELCLEWFDRPQGSYYITATDVSRAMQMAGCKGRYQQFMRKLGWRPGNVVIPFDGRKCRVWIKHPNDHVTECTRLEPAQPQHMPHGRVEMRSKMAIPALPYPLPVQESVS